MAVVAAEGNPEIEAARTRLRVVQEAAALSARNHAFAVASAQRALNEVWTATREGPAA